MNADKHSIFLISTDFLDFKEQKVQDFVSSHTKGGSDRERAVSLYYAVRDGFRYDPYRIEISTEGLRASSVLDKGYGWCVTKAVLLAAACRAIGIPSRLGYADVRNHLSTERLRQTLKTDVFYYHGYTDIWLDGAWRKATPAFNIELCDRFGLHPLDFDGRNDSIYHPFDKSGQRHMEYIHFHGECADVPLQKIRDTFDREYPGVLNTLSAADFQSDVLSEPVP
ncbi:MAG: transglutaminase [Salinisphaeraceae bacterium]|nr:transglutaminase [Salinisphaeraceae bacterium]